MDYTVSHLIHTFYVIFTAFEQMLMPKKQQMNNNDVKAFFLIHSLDGWVLTQARLNAYGWRFSYITEGSLAPACWPAVAFTQTRPDLIGRGGIQRQEKEEGGELGNIHVPLIF